MESISRRKLMALKEIICNGRSNLKVEYISSEYYNNNDIFKMEQEEIFSKVWVRVSYLRDEKQR